MGQERVVPARVMRMPKKSDDDEEELRIKLRTIVKGEQSTCHILQLELMAAIEVTKPWPDVRVRAEEVVARLAEAEQAYGELLARLGKPEAPNLGSKSLRAISKRR